VIGESSPFLGLHRLHERLPRRDLLVQAQRFHASGFERDLLGVLD
jgi:hypothetical protein